mmetsp:Transcript_73515/g.219466  ORF Transcript_73515/g.219466 Transcript_73515/m.219466 type:complete len:255 (-) Transcript_73515:662-1426(-)
MTLIWLAPAVDLDRDACGQVQVHNVKRLARPTLLHDRALVVVLQAHWRLCVLPMGAQRVETILDVRTIPRNEIDTHNKLVTLEELATNAHLLRHREAVGHASGFILALDIDSLAADNPVLAGRVVIRTLTVKRQGMRVAKDQAGLHGTEWGWRGNGLWRNYHWRRSRPWSWPWGDRPEVGHWCLSGCGRHDDHGSRRGIFFHRLGVKHGQKQVEQGNEEQQAADGDAALPEPPTVVSCHDLPLVGAAALTDKGV